MYMSSSHEVDIQVSAFRPDDENRPRFLIKYQGECLYFILFACIIFGGLGQKPFYIFVMCMLPSSKMVISHLLPTIIPMGTYIMSNSVYNWSLYMYYKKFIEQ